MSYDLIETSRDDGRPIELIQIAYTGNFWYYTSADREVVHDGRTYKPVAWGRGELEPSPDASKASLPLTFPRDVEFAEVFRIQPPSEVVTVTLLARHYLNDGYAVFWKGRIINADWQGPVVQFTSESVFSSLKRPGLRRRYSTNCPYALYGADCKVSRDAWRETGIVSGLNGLTLFAVPAAGKTNNYYAGGYVTWENNTAGNVEKRMIRSSLGANGALTLASLPVGLSPGQQVNLYPGCDHTLGSAGCAKFNNILNFGGTPYIPQKNPFGSAPLY